MHREPKEKRPRIKPAEFGLIILLGSIRAMKNRIIPFCLFIGGILVASYFGWALHRISGMVLVSEGHAWPRPFPFPDSWLFQWDHQLEVAHPPLPEHMNMEGQLPRIRSYLAIWIGLSLLVAFGSFIWLAILRRRDHDV